MAEATSDLNVRIKITNTDKNAVPKLKKDLEELGDVQGPEHLADQFDATAEAIKQLSGSAGLQQVIDDIAALAEQAGVTAETFGTFIEDTASSLETLAEEAQKTGDSVQGDLLDKLAEGMKEFTKTPEFESLIGQFKKVDDSLAQTGEVFDVTGAHKDKFRENLGGLSADLGKADRAIADFNKAAFAIDFRKANKDIEDFNKAAFGPKPAGPMDVLKGKVAQLAAGFTAGSLAVKAFDFALETLHNTIEFVAEGIRLAAQTQQLDTALAALAASGAATAEGLEKSVTGLEKLGFSSISARENVVRLTQAEKILTDIEVLGAAATSQAVVAGKTREEVLGTLVNALSNHNLRALRSIGITINQARAEKDFADTLGVTSSSLTESQKQLAIETAALNAMAKASTAAVKGANDLNQKLIELNSKKEATQERIGQALLPTMTAIAKARLDAANLREIQVKRGLEALAAGGQVAEGFLEAAAKRAQENTQKRIDRALDNQEKKARRIFENVTFGLEPGDPEIAKAQETLDKTLAEIEKKRKESSDRSQKELADSFKVQPSDALPTINDIKEKIQSLVGEQPLAKVREGFTDLSKEGQEAVTALGVSLSDFSRRDMAQVQQSAGQIRQQIGAAFARQKTADDFENFLREIQKRTLSFKIDLKSIEQEAAFRKQNVILKDLLSTMTAFADASERLMQIRRDYDRMVAEGTQQEIALQQITAEAANDRMALNALELRSAAVRLASEKDQFQAIRDNTIRQRDEAVKRINENETDENRKSEKIRAIQKDFTVKSLKEYTTYYDNLKHLQDDYTEKVRQSERELKRVRDENAKGLRTASQQLRDAQRALLTPQDADRDKIAEQLEREEALKEAISKGDIARAKEELQLIRASAAERASSGGVKEKEELVGVLARMLEFDKDIGAIEEANAARSVDTDRKNLQNVKAAVEETKAIIADLREQAKIDIKIQLDPSLVNKSLDELKEKVAAAPPVPVSILFWSSDADLTKLKEQVQTFLDKQRFTVPLSVKSSGSPEAGSAQGGLIGGYSPNPTADNLLSWITAGEFVQPVAAVRHYGSAFMESIRRMQFPRFAGGGEVDSPSSSSGAGDMTTLNLNINGKPAGKVVGTRDQVRSIVSAFKSVSLGT